MGSGRRLGGDAEPGVDDEERDNGDDDDDDDDDDCNDKDER